jgi:hypothetical protein
LRAARAEARMAMMNGTEFRRDPRHEQSLQALPNPFS